MIFGISQITQISPIRENDPPVLQAEWACSENLEMLFDA